METARRLPTAWARNLRAYDRYRMLVTRPRNWPVVTTVLWGPPGSGKSARFALEEPDALWVARGNSGSVWFDGYEAQESLVIDEFYGWISRDQMQRLCDRYPYTLQTKGGSRSCQVRRVGITSNQHPSLWWKIGLGAMERRLDVVEYVDYSTEFPCVKCKVHPHAQTCDYIPPRCAPTTASRGPAAPAGYYSPGGDYVVL